MLIEIPDLDVILSVIIAFFIGLIGLFVYFKLSPMIKSKGVTDVSQTQRLEYYERQLIDMKIRLDALEIQGIEQKVEDPNLELKQFLEKLAKNKVQERPIEVVAKAEIVPEKIDPTPIIQNITPTNPIDYVLHLITTKAMTSRDIQITLKRSREHTSRLMKKLFEDGYVKRNVDSKPYSYSISEKGKEKISLKPSSSIIA